MPTFGITYQRTFFRRILIWALLLQHINCNNSQLWYDTNQALWYDTNQSPLIWHHQALWYDTNQGPLIWHQSGPFDMTPIRALWYDTNQGPLIWHQSGPFDMTSGPLIWHQSGPFDMTPIRPFDMTPIRPFDDTNQALWYDTNQGPLIWHQSGPFGMTPSGPLIWHQSGPFGMTSIRALWYDTNQALWYDTHPIVYKQQHLRWFAKVSIRLSHFAVVTIFRLKQTEFYVYLKYDFLHLQHKRQTFPFHCSWLLPTYVYYICTISALVCFCWICHVYTGMQLQVDITFYLGGLFPT